VHDVRGRGRQDVVGKQPDLQPADDWLGDLSDEDWSEEAATFAERRRVTQEESYTERNGLAPSRAEALPAAPTDPHRATVERRRAVAALVLLVLIGLAGAAAVLLLRDGADPPVTTASTTVSTPTETDPAETTPSTAPTETTPAASENASTFTLPEGTKLQRGESLGESDLTVSTDPELIADLQRALTTAGYDPGTADGDFGLNTEAAVVAFQQANGLSPDGIVGPETAEALNDAVAGD
jgi:murein L,D-transpeptidase YcbB/YkuD